MLTTFDRLNLSSHPDATKMLEKNGDEKEFFVYSNEVMKINRKGKKQARTLAITDKAVYNLDKKTFKKCKRRIPLRDIVQITVSNSSNEFVLHVPGEYDYIYMSDDKKNISKVLKQQRKRSHGYPPEVKYTQKENLFNIAKNKAELEEPMSIGRCHDLVLQPYKIHQTKQGRVMKIPRNRSLSSADSILKHRLRKSKDWESMSSLQSFSIDDIAMSSSRLDSFGLSVKPPSDRVKKKRPSKAVKF